MKTTIQLSAGPFQLVKGEWDEEEKPTKKDVDFLYAMKAAIIDREKKFQGYQGISEKLAKEMDKGGY